MSIISAIQKGLGKVSSWTSDVENVLSGNLSERKELKNQVTQSIVDSEGAPIIFDAGRFINQNDVMKRFHLGNEYGSQSSNTVFTPGFEDPTRLMFKIEFGEWGASLLDLETIRAQQVTSKFSNVYYEDYDQFPMGLLNLDFDDFNGNTSWNDQKSYNTYNYLMNRNEDARASYIKQFVQGLYVIQKDMPYIFQKISGIEKLQELNLGKGKRLKDAKITLDCIEGIDLKIRTLLQLYRKAAYDDVWQRWTLPDIYRYFKMIIYIFDRRILHTGVGTYSIDQDNFPIYAFECGPCEIDIESTFENELSAVYSDHKDSETKISITVHNVKTYYSNKLFNKVESNNYVVNWISDFDSVQERGSYTSTDSSNETNFRQRWMRRMFMTPSEYKAYYNNVNHKFGSKATDVDENNISDEQILYTHDGGGVIWPDNSWHKAIVQNESIYDIRSWSGLVKYLKKSAHIHTTMIRDSRFADRTYMVNDLVRPYEYSYIYEPRFMYMAPDVRRAQRMMRMRIEQMIQHMLNSTYVHGNQYFYSLVDPGMLDTSLPNMVPDVSPNISGEIPEYEYVKPILNTSLPKQTYVEPIMNLDKPDQEYVEPIMNLDKPEQDYIEPIMNLDKPDQDYIEPIMDLHKNDMEYVTPEFDLHKNDMEYVTPEFDLHKIDMEYVTPEFDLHKNDMNLVNPQQDLHKNDMEYVTPEQDLHKNDMEYVTPEFDEHKNDMAYVTPEFDLHKNDMAYITPEFDLHKNDMEYVTTEQDLHKNDMEFVKPVFDEHKNDMEFVKPVFDEHKNDMEFVQTQITDEHVLHNMVSYEYSDETPSQTMINVKPYFDEHKPEMTMYKDVQDEHKVNMSMIPDIQDEHKANMSMYKDIQDEHKPEMSMIHDVQDEHKPEMSMIHDVQDTNKDSMSLVIPQLNIDKEKHNLIPINVTNEPQSHNQMVIPEYDEFKSNTLLIPLDGDDTKFTGQMNSLEITTKTNPMDMVSLNIEQSKVLMDMTQLSTDASLPEMDMVSMSQNTSLPDMDMIHLSQNTSLPEMDMTKPVMNTSLSDMIMTKPVMNMSLPNMDMSKPIMNTSLPDMIMTTPVMNTSLSDMIMTKPIMNTSLSDMVMTKPVMNTEINDMVMTTPDEVKDIPVTPMVSPYLNTDKVHAPMISPNLNTDKVHAPMNKLNQDVETPVQEMTRPIMDTSTSTMDMITTILDSGETPKMKMVELTDSPELVQKIQALTRIDVNELKTTNIQELLSLADIIEKTYDEIRDRSKHMKLQDNKPNIPPHVHMKMQSIKQPERNQYLVKKINAVDQAAIDRAWNAKQNAESDHSEGRRGQAI